MAEAKITQTGANGGHGVLPRDPSPSRNYIEASLCIVGGGPAGLAAAAAATERGDRVLLIDDNRQPGGQIWRADSRDGRHPAVSAQLAKIPAERFTHLAEASIVAAPAPGELLAETPAGSRTIRYERLLIASGARERFLPFPGWTLPNVTGAGGLQALVKGGMPIAGKRVVIAGSGPLLIPVAATLRAHGAEVLAIAEQAPRRRLLRFGLAVLTDPAKLLQAVSYWRALRGTPYLTDCYPVAADGDERVQRVILQQGAKIWQVECDYFACGFHLVPNLELARLLGCRTESGRVVVDQLQRTSVDNVLAAGEATGIGGLDLSLVEGAIAGYTATGDDVAARRLFAKRRRARRFAEILERAFAPGEVLKDLPSDRTTVCRCEDVTLGSLRRHSSWRTAKLQTRCGMGPCQGRICGPAVEYLLGWSHESVRPPVLPARVDSLRRSGGTDDSN